MLIKQDLALSKIIDHPINASIYRDNFDDELVESVKANGVLSPIVVIGPQPDAPVPKARLLESAIAHVRATRDPALGHDACWMIGDRHHDIDAAVEVGTGSIGVMWGYGDEAELRGAGATHIAHAPADLLLLLG